MDEAQTKVLLAMMLREIVRLSAENAALRVSYCELAARVPLPAPDSEATTVDLDTIESLHAQTEKEYQARFLAAMQAKFPPLAHLLDGLVQAEGDPAQPESN